MQAQKRYREKKKVRPDLGLSGHWKLYLALGILEARNHPLMPWVSLKPGTIPPASIAASTDATARLLRSAGASSGAEVPDRGAYGAAGALDGLQEPAGVALPAA